MAVTVKMAFDTKELQARFKRVTYRVLNSAMKQAVRAGAAEVRKKMRAMAPVGTSENQGTLKKSIYNNVRGYQAKGIIYSAIGPRSSFVDATEGKRPSLYAHLVEGGAKQHAIEPKVAKALKFIGGSSVKPNGRNSKGQFQKYTRTGPIRFAKAINHPGAKAQPFMAKSADAAFNAAVGKFSTKAIAALDKEIAKG